MSYADVLYFLILFGGAFAPAVVWKCVNNVLRSQFNTKRIPKCKQFYTHYTYIFTVRMFRYKLLKLKEL